MFSPADPPYERFSRVQLEFPGNPPGTSLEFAITFDGGSLGNPGVGYGSYSIIGPGVAHQVIRLEFSQNGEVVTNNQAEYRTLIAALSDLRNRLGSQADRAAVTVHGDSKLVIEQVSGRWKVRNAELRPLAVQAREIIAAFGKVDLTWHPRSKSVDRLGH
jgi:probable phosphoglycerate mutase